MCGIAGWYRRGGAPVTVAAIRAQCDAIRHRGPDDDGILVDGDFGCGMRRLSILDVAGGHQPIATRDGRYAIVFNGEIYNHQALRREPALRDYPFTTQSDTETILAGYAVWGDDVWPRLEGMFAVAIWDTAERQLTLARDPIGIKPLYVTEQDGGIAFASELKALRSLSGHRFTIDPRAVSDYFGFGHVRRPGTIFREVATLEPGHVLSIGPSGPARSAAYWHPRFRPAPARSEAEWIEEMRARLDASTARHLQSDVPVGAFLSGGIDSSAVLACMARHAGSGLHAFTIGHPGADIDETRAASEIARHLGCRHIVAPLELDAVCRDLPAILRSYDEPFADMAAIPTWYASRLAAGHVKVVLCGEGGDELFAGYKRHRNAQMITRWRAALHIARPIGRAVGRIPAFGSRRLATLRQNADRFADFATLDDGFQQFFAATQIAGQAVRETLFAPGRRAAFLRDQDYAALERRHFGEGREEALGPLDQLLLADLTVNMPSAMLTRLDRASMAHSVEARVPFLSHTLVDWALTVPGDLKLRGTTGKHILRQAVAPWLPPAIAKRPKQGFQIPFAAWFRGALGDLARDVWHGSGLREAGYLDAHAVDGLFAGHRSGAANHGRLLYAITAFGLWWQEHHATARMAAA